MAARHRLVMYVPKEKVPSKHERQPSPHARFGRNVVGGGIRRENWKHTNRYDKVDTQCLPKLYRRALAMVTIAVFFFLHMEKLVPRIKDEKLKNEKQNLGKKNQAAGTLSHIFA
ncbi:hypothetical protein T10_13383 [Trichinella papuae]|uniref:Uncharacterized protein n=1 Tax=Trichinella papuae TaxID=268474 RepID=A0A0V1N0M4_9BILA|nr:hypothetical protein T10_13383 [Trichinella papuae]